MTRVISGVALAVVTLAAILFLPVVALRVLACVVAALAAREYLEIADSPIRAVVLVVALCWMASGGVMPSSYVLFAMGLLWVAVEVLISNHTIQQASTGIFAAVYIGMPLGMLVAVHSQWHWPATLLLIGTVAVSDSMQYYTGRLFGRHPLAPAISPKKTIEGAVGGVIFGTAFMTVVGARVLPFAGFGPLITLGVLVVGLGICGDLFESRLKRTAGVKDSSALIPGHGGVLDRIDALLFAAAPFYLYVRNLT
ncbi:MAG TPA: phosphatidate cytidylyltransferase [Vicinamibacterales bacterium]|nr:phosphatidate cytidylyltransferase [Vicinamibacterales bacterium]